jgi:YD repeat-containing protein
MLRIKRFARKASARLFVFTICFSMLLSTVPVTPSKLISLAQGNNNGGGLRTTGAPSPNLPNLDAARGRKEAKPKMDAPVPAKRCRWFDKKCKETKEKKSDNRFSPAPNGLENLIASAKPARSKDYYARLFDWRDGNPFTLPEVDRLIGGVERPVNDLPVGISKRKSNRARASAPAATPFFQSNDPMITARLDAKYRTGSPGEDLFSGNFNWSITLVSLPGRAGHNLDIPLSYNSVTWVRSGNTMYFDPDLSYYSPGFRIGLPVMYGPYYNPQTLRNFYLLITPSGRAVELRQISSSQYESGDSTFTRMNIDTSGYYILKTTDGTQYKFQSPDQCIEIKDRNGNLITATYTAFGTISTITDTLGRVINFNYNYYNTLDSITQLWQGIMSTVVTFGYADYTLSTNFNDNGTPLSLGNVTNGMTLSLLNQVSFLDGTKYTFDYTSYAQVRTIFRYGSNFLRAQIDYNLPTGTATPQSDCPLFTQRTDWAYEWNTVNTNFSAVLPDRSSREITFPDGTKYKEFFATTGWQRGLLTQTETRSADNVLRKWTTLQWEQIDAYSYQSNPRVIESHVYDAEGNHRRTTIGYTSYNLPLDVYEYDSDGTTVLRRTHTDYQLGSAYTTRRIIGLPSAKLLYDGAGGLQSKVQFYYDESGFLDSVRDAGGAVATAIMHDGANYGTGFRIGRGNLSTVRRYSVNADTPAYVDSKIGYNITGSAVFRRDPLSHQTDINYADSFSDGGNNRNTFAYPSRVTDPDGFSSYATYQFDYGFVTRTTNPKGASTLRSYDIYGRVTQITNEFNGAYTRHEYDPNQYYVSSYSTIQEGQGEFYSITIIDGHDRLRATVSEHPGSANGYKGVYNVYDVMGRPWQQSNPTEINGYWIPSGDDSAWWWSVQSYDWNGRPLVTTDTLGKTKQVSYTGCGCAGGLTATFTDEMGRRRRVISDILGRTWKTQVLKSDGTAYSTVTNIYNVRDQITNVEEKDETTGVSQQTMMSYDGHGRLRTRKRPQDDGPTTFDYYNDDRLMHSKDARNAEGSLTYNARGLLTAATYVTPNGVAPTSSVTFQYDASGMRTVMDDGPGQVTYQYDSQNRLTGETRAFDAIAGKVFTLSYGYNLSGQLTAITYSATGAASDTINYTRDKAGRITAITGTPYGGVTSYVSGIQYRAWGAPKAASYGSGFSASAKYTARMQVSEFDIPGVIGGTYTYNDDGQLSAFVASTPQYSQYDRRMDRTFGYDEFSRMNSSVAGGYGFVATYSPQQDAFGNVTNASYHYWQNGNQPVTFSAAYQNNRVAPGSVTDAGQAQTWNYDAMGNRTSIVKTINGTPTTVESIAVDAVGRGVAGATLDGDGRTAIGQGNYYIRSTVFGGEIITTVDSSGVKTSERVLDGESLLAEQIKFSDGATSVRWHHRDPLNLVARDTEPGQVTQRVFAITPNGAQIETSEGVNLTQYYTCLYAGNNNPSCTGYNPQPASSYGYLADQANGMLAAGLKVDGALTLMSLNDVMRQVGRTGLGQPIISPALSGTPIASGISGSFVRRSVLGWQEVAGTVTAKGGYERDYVSTVVDVWEFVPGQVAQINEAEGIQARSLKDEAIKAINKFLNDNGCGSFRTTANP